MDESPVPEEFQPNETFVRELMETLQIPRKLSVRALFETGNQNPDLAAQWIFERNSSESSDEEGQGEDSFPEVKMVIVVNESLHMGAGKMASQVAHAAVELYRHITHRAEVDKGSDWLLSVWEASGQKKIVLRAEGAEQLQALMTSAKSKGLASSIICDAGLTEIPEGSVTTLAVIGKVDDVDQVTGKLSLLR